jgi:hypothetical protein
MTVREREREREGEKGGGSTRQRGFIELSGSNNSMINVKNQNRC